MYQLQDSSATTTDENDTLIVSLLAIKKCFTSLATRENNTLLAPRLGGVNDVYLNPLEPVLTSNATMVSDTRVNSILTGPDSGVLFELTEPRVFQL